LTPPVALGLLALTLVAVALGTGTVLARALGLRRWARRTPEAAAVAGVLGAMAWTIGFVVLSGRARLPARAALLVLLGTLVLLCGVAWARRRPGRARPRQGRAAWLALGAACLLATALALLPVWVAEGFPAGNDTYTYCALAEWLQVRGFGEPAPRRLDSPVDALVAEQQDRGFPLGGTAPLALVRAAGGSSTSLAPYPAVSALGLVLSVGALWAASRLVARAPTPVAAAVSLAFAVAPHVGYWAHHNGFLSQTLAVPALLAGLVALAAGRGLGERSGLVLWAMAVAYMCLAYLPFVPLLLAATASHAAFDVAAGPRPWPSTARRLALAGLVAALLVGFDVPSVVRGLALLLGIQGAGTHVPAPPLALGALALGLGPDEAVAVPRAVPAGAAPLAIAAAGLAALGLVGGRDRRRLGLLAVLAVMALLVAWNAFVARDPWTTARGQTWSLFKAAQWAFPLLLLVQAAGLARLRRRAAGVEAVFVAGAFALAPAHLPAAVERGRGLAGIVDGERPLRSLETVARGFHGLPAGPIVLLGQPGAVSPFRGGYVALLAWPRGILGDWSASASIPLDAEAARVAQEGLVARLGEAGAVALLADAPPFDTGDREDLGGGHARLAALDRPRLVQLVDRAPRWLRAVDSRRPASLGGQRVKLVVFAPREGTVQVGLGVELPPPPATVRVVAQAIRGHAAGAAFRAAVRDQPAWTVELSPPGPTPVRLDVPPGLSALLLEAEGRPRRLAAVRLGWAEP
jgi:hypothetical protein